MARFPVIESPCPIQGKALPAGASEHCTLCDRAVHNLNLMNDAQRREFMSACSGKVCVAYTMRIPVGKMPVRHRGLAAATLAATALASLPLAAQDTQPESPVGPMSPLPDAISEADLPNCDEYYDVVLVGGVTHGDQAEWTDDEKDAPPELPTIEDDGR